ncbi:hypothetical protein GH733_002928 [Mirounga leonina]|nr:hypothetical protein GH733_002928 [Mirounga leonina]
MGPGAQKVQKGDKGPFDVEALDEIRMRCVVKLEKQSDAKKTELELEEEDDEELDETRLERLWGLTEMFPERVPPQRFPRAALWIGTTSLMIPVLPVVLETEKLQMERQLRRQQILRSA